MSSPLPSDAAPSVVVRRDNCPRRFGFWRNFYVRGGGKMFPRLDIPSSGAV